MVESLADGLLWFVSPDEIAQRFSMAADDVDGNVAELATSAAEKGADAIRDVIIAGGEKPTAKGGPRIKSGDMLSSVDSNVKLNGRGRIQGAFGFINGAPDYTRYQDRGTRNIPAMLAMARGFQVTYDALDGDLRTGRWMPSSVL